MVQEYTDEERELLRLAQSMRNIMDTKSWKVYSQILESQIATRESILLDGAPGQLTELQIEHIKGARLGLKLALETINLIITDANNVARANDANEGED